jgi:hypothetical protein
LADEPIWLNCRRGRLVPAMGDFRNTPKPDVNFKTSAPVNLSIQFTDK